MKFKRLKIVEQIIIISLIGVLIPSVISYFIINNISQHSIRRELNYSAEFIAKNIENNIFSMIKADQHRLNEIIIALKHFPSEYKQKLFLKDVLINSATFKNFEMIRPSENPDFDKNEKVVFNDDSKIIWLVEKIHDDKYLKAEINTQIIKDIVLKNIENERKRQIYIVNNEGEVIVSHNYIEKDFQDIIKTLPINLVNNIATIFSEIKNQPRIYLKMEDLGLIVIVNTPETLTDETINKARFKILLAFILAACFTLFLTLAYSYYLYINMRQLFKGVTAVAKGNYKRHITPLTNFLTPREIIIICEELNEMINEINSSYKKVKHKNTELKQLDAFRSNLVDTVSHELRTPLTSIKGYTSRLLRTDIEIDEETKRKSLLIIKNQSERLSRMIEDLLVIPDIEGAKLNINFEPVNILNVIEESIYSVKNIEDRTIENNIPNDFPLICADKDRLTQVIVNLLGNANKYAYEDSSIIINAKVENDKAIISVENNADYIDEKTLKTLFDKFIRIDDKTTRTTRGTGLGLFIVKGLVEAMQGSVKLISTQDNKFISTVTLPIYEDENYEA